MKSDKMLKNTKRYMIIFITLFYSTVLISTTCKESMKPFINMFANLGESVKIPQNLLKYIDFPKYNLEESEYIPAYFPKAKTNINTIELESGIMGELVVYYNIKNKKIFF